MCPEMLLTGASDLKADVWSFGAVAHLLLCGELPYYPRECTAKTMKLAIAHGSPVKCTQRLLSKSACELVDAILNRDPESRPTAELVLRMPFFRRSSNDS